MANLFNLVSSALFALLFLQLAAAQAGVNAPVPCAEAPQDIWLVTQDWKTFSLKSLGVWYAKVPAVASQPERRMSPIERRKKSEETGEIPSEGPGADCTFTQLFPGRDGTLLFTNTAAYRQIVCVTTILGSDKMSCYWLNAGDSCTTTTSTQWLLFSAGPGP
ncbi:hypothetical protein CSHISOI_10847 [Colletotrichum shisoi]|uniref:Uncharacterized protein n=1 Tax=Colletotrichum shisoi TaxID=2078593 RepID=A0A5Q4BCC2_9PEZI|nr:hypothetical protein CSHISOI_10847 [Colletotrichum shisoi]